MENLYCIGRSASAPGGDIYIGVVGPVRSGKSTFIKQFMEELVLPALTRPRRQDPGPG